MSAGRGRRVGVGLGNLAHGAVDASSSSQLDCTPIVRTQSGAAGGITEQENRSGIRQHLLQALAGVGRIERDVGAAGLEDGEEPDEHRGRALQTQRDAILGLHSERDQVMGEAVGLRR